jgi:hypothetical protein
LSRDSSFQISLITLEISEKGTPRSFKSERLIILVSNSLNLKVISLGNIPVLPKTLKFGLLFER